MMRVLGRDIAKQVGIDEVGSGIDLIDSHLSHGGLDAHLFHRESVPLGNGGNAATSVECPAGIDLVDPVPKSHLLG